MSGNFKLDDYVDVAERIREFNAKYPEGSLQSELTWLESGWLCKAFAFRSATDDRPGIGHAFEPVPGKTPYTKDSEAMNAETSAWGRAIVALGFDTKKIASRQEVQARTGSASNGSPAEVGEAVSGTEKPAPASSFQVPEKAREGALGFEESHGGNVTQEERNREAAARVKVHFGKNVDKTLAELTQKQVAWYAGEGWLETTSKALSEGKKQSVTGKDLQLRQAARCYLGIEPIFETVGPFSPDDDLPF